MNVRTLLRPVRRLWPQKIRTRLTLIYATLFFAAGLALLALTYGLVASSLPARAPAAVTVSSQELANLKRECTPGSITRQVKHPVPIPKSLFIPDDAVPSLFEPFGHMQPRTGVRDGVGLGLSIARSVLTAHRATVTAQSQPNGGLDISVVIPRDPAAGPQP